MNAWKTTGMWLMIFLFILMSCSSSHKNYRKPGGCDCYQKKRYQSIIRWM